MFSKNLTYNFPSFQLCPLVEKDAVVLSKKLSELEPWKILNYSTSTLYNYLTKQEEYCLYRYAIMVDDNLAGVICIRYPWLRGGYIELVGVFPEYQQSGIGNKLINWIETQLNENENIWALVSSFNEKAQLFYKKNGFIEIGKVENLVKENFNEIFLRKSLQHK